MRTTPTLAALAALTASILASCSTAPPAAPARPPSAESILQRMAQTYRSASSYADSGEVYTCRNGARENASIRFRIHFVRPDRLRFDLLQDVGSPYQPEHYEVVWSDGAWTYSWSQGHPQIRTSRDVTAVIAQFTGVSGRAIHNIPSLLQPNFGGRDYLYDISSPQLLGEEVFEKTDCYHIQGKGSRERLLELWIGKSDSLIRKIRTTYSDFSNEEIHHSIALNEPVAPVLLSFTPPMSIDN